jgi:hypothetical protein
VICDGEFEVLDVIPPFVVVVVVVVCKWKGRCLSVWKGEDGGEKCGWSGRSVDMVSELGGYTKLMNKSMVGMCEDWRKLIRWLNMMGASSGLCGIEVVRWFYL